MKPQTLKIVKTDGGFACYSKASVMHPSAVFKTPWEVLDWLSDQMAEWADEEILEEAES